LRNQAVFGPQRANQTLKTNSSPACRLGILVFALLLSGVAPGPGAGIENVTVLPAWSGQGLPKLAMGRENALAAWYDFRTYEDLISEIYVARIAPSGLVLDPQGIRVSDSRSGGYAVAALGNTFLIVWSRGPNLYARRMNGGGEILDQAPIVITKSDSNSFSEGADFQPTAASDGASFWVAWVDFRNAPAGTPEYRMWEYQDIYAARISVAGELLDPNGIKISARPGQQSEPKLSNGGNFIIWRDSAVRGARLSPDGSCLDRGGVLVANSTNPAFHAEVSGNGQGWLVAISDENQIRGVHVRRDGAPSEPFAIAQTSTYGYTGVRNSGGDYVVWWKSGPDTMAVKVRASGEVGKATVLASSSDPLYSVTDVAATGAGFLVTGATQPAAGGWMYADVWMGTFNRDSIPSVPPKIIEVVRVPNGFRITFTATKGVTYRIEAASNTTSTDWTAVADIVATSRVMSWTDRRERRTKTGIYRVREVAE
jgi:hypothetical protein